MAVDCGLAVAVPGRCAGNAHGVQRFHPGHTIHGHPTACVCDAAFAYVGASKAYVDAGFSRGAEIADPAGLLESTGQVYAP